MSALAGAGVDDDRAAGGQRQARGGQDGHVDAAATRQVVAVAVVDGSPGEMAGLRGDAARPDGDRAGGTGLADGVRFRLHNVAARIGQRERHRAGGDGASRRLGQRDQVRQEAIGERRRAGRRVEERGGGERAGDAAERGGDAGSAATNTALTIANAPEICGTKAAGPVQRRPSAPAGPSRGTEGTPAPTPGRRPPPADARRHRPGGGRLPSGRRR